jgi:hypothetical protein
MTFGSSIDLLIVYLESSRVDLFTYMHVTNVGT